MAKYEVLVSTHPFGEASAKPLDYLKAHGCQVTLNPYGRKMTGQEEKDLLPRMDALIAGTEQLSSYTLGKARNLRVISRVGVGLDGLDWAFVEQKGIKVSYTPDAPAMAVAELTVGLMISLARHIPHAHGGMRQRVWEKRMGKLLRWSTVGIVGMGRIGSRVGHMLSRWGCNILRLDLAPDPFAFDLLNLTDMPKDELLTESDFVTLHLPLTVKTHHWIDADALRLMKKDAYLINTSRGGVVNEEALYTALTEGWIAGAAIDVYAQEPYKGPLCDLPNVILTCHMGAATQESRGAMEWLAATDCVRLLQGKKAHYPATEECTHYE